jgi:opacity protein-like surface antigen
MKNVIIAAALAGTFATSVAAAEWTRPAVIGKTEYNVTTEKWAYDAGVQVDMLGVVLTPKVKGAYSSTTNFDFLGSEINAAYAVHETATAYVTVTADDNWKYADTTVGVSFKF